MNTKRLFWILFGLNLLNYIDRQALYAVFPLLQTDLHLSDFQLGTLASAFMLVYMCYAPVMGFLADRLRRPRLIAISALLWSGATGACGLAGSYISLLIPRALIGVGEGGFTTIAQPFLAENYPQEKHASVLAAFGLALPLGSALGYVLGGLVGQHWGWRAAFIALSIPGIFLAVMAWFSLRETRPAVPPPHILCQDYKTLLTNKPFLSVCFSQALMTFVMGGLAAWMPTYLHRYLSLDIAQAGTYFGALVIVAGAAGTYLGGKLAAYWLTRSGRAYYQLIFYSFLAALPFCWLTLFAPGTLSALCFLGLALILLFLPTGAIAAALVATTQASIRSMAFAVNIFMIHLLGDAISPILIGWMSNTWNLKLAVFGACLLLLPAAWSAGRVRN